MGSLALLEDSDKIFMTRFADPVDAGLYAASYRLVSLGLIPVKALVNSSHPRFLVDTPGARTEHLTRALRFTAPAAAYTLVATAGIVLIAPVVPRLLGGEYAGTAAIMVMLAPLVLFRSLALFPLNALLGLARYRMRLLVIFGCAVLNVGLNLVLVPRWSYHGAIVSTLVSEVVFFVAAWTCVAVAQRQHDQRRSADEGGGPEELADGGSQSARPR
jgi:O-antigen/teichoic acid export membrane protein